MTLPTRRAYGRTRPPPKESPWAILGAILFLAVGACVFAYYYESPATQTALGSTSYTASTSATSSASHSAAAPVAPESAPVPPPGSLDDNILNREQADNDNLISTYAKDWVLLDGTKVSGITSVVAAPQFQVAITSANGTQNVAASSLPPGFLTLWAITPQALEAANQPKDKTNP